MRHTICIVGKNRTAICGFLVAPRPAGVMAALLLAFPCLTMQIDAAKAQTYVAGTITFSNMMPTGVFIYKCTGSGAGPSPLCDSQQQLGISGYITPVPLQRNPVGDPLDPAPQAFLYATGSYVLWQRGQKTGSWNSCMLTIDPQKGSTASNSNCPGLVWVNDPTKPGYQPAEPVVAINLYNNNGYIMPDGTTYSSGQKKLTTPPSPRESQPSFPSRAFTVKYTGSNEAICLNLVGTFNQAPCSKDPNDISIPKGQSYAWIYKDKQNFCDPTDSKCNKNGPYIPNSVFVVSGIKLSRESGFTPVGQNFGTNPYNTGKGYTAYGGRYEFAFFPQARPASDVPKFQGGTLSTGVSTVDMSLVNGYNFGFLLYPTQPTICALSKQERGVPHYYLWSSSNLMSAFVAKTSYCPTNQQVAVTVNGAKIPAGCQSDGAYATNNNSQWADAYNCHGNYSTETTCPPPASDPPPYGYTPAKPPSDAPKPWRSYSEDLAIGKQENGKDILSNAYTWAYQDFRGTFTCDGDAQNYTVEISDPQ